MEVAQLTLETALRSTGHVGVQIWIRDDPSRPREIGGQRNIASMCCLFALHVQAPAQVISSERQMTARKTSPCGHEEVQINLQRRAFVASAN
jgi:hypothetical protein